MTKQNLCVILALVAGIFIGIICSALCTPTGVTPKGGPTKEFHKYDVNQDGTVSQLDVLHIVNYLNRTR